MVKMENAHTQSAQDLREQEANNVAFRFMDSQNVMDDMEQELNADFSGVKLHTDSYADQVARSHGRDAVAKGKDIFFGAGMFDMQRPESRGLLAHELTHTMQQGVSGGAVQESAPMGAEQGGLISWFISLFHRRAPQAPQVPQAGPEEDPQPEPAPLQEIEQHSPEEYLRKNDELTLNKANEQAANQFNTRKTEKPNLGITTMNGFTIQNNMMPLRAELQTNIAAANKLPNGGKAGENMNYNALARLVGLSGPMERNPLSLETAESRKGLFHTEDKNSVLSNSMTTEIVRYYQTLMKNGVSMRRLAERRESILFNDEANEQRSINRSKEIHSVARGLFSTFSAYLETPNIVEYIRLLSIQLNQAAVFGGKQDAVVNFILEHLMREYALSFDAMSGLDTMLLEDRENLEFDIPDAPIYTKDHKNISFDTRTAIDNVNAMVMNIFVQLPVLEKKGDTLPAELPDAAREMVGQYKALRQRIVSRIATAPKFIIEREAGATLPKQPESKSYTILNEKTGKQVPFTPTSKKTQQKSEQAKPKYTIVRDDTPTSDTPAEDTSSKFTKELNIRGQKCTVRYDVDPGAGKETAPPQGVTKMVIGGKPLDIVYENKESVPKQAEAIPQAVRTLKVGGKEFSIVLEPDAVEENKKPPEETVKQPYAPNSRQTSKPNIVFEEGYDKDAAPKEKKIAVTLPGKNYTILIDADDEEQKKRYGIK